MNLRRTFSTTVSMLFLLGLTIIVSVIFYVARGGEVLLGVNQIDIELETSPAR